MTYHLLLKQHLEQSFNDNDDFTDSIQFNEFCKKISSSYTLNQENQQKAQEQIEEAKTLYQKQDTLIKNLESTLNAAAAGLMIVDLDHQPIFINPIIVSILDTTKEALMEGGYDYFQQLVKERSKDAAIFLKQFADTLEDPTLETICMIYLTDGRAVEIVSKTRELEGKLVGRVWVLYEMTNSRYDQNASAYRAYHDVLTNMPNRYLFVERLQLALDEQKKNDSKLALLYIDLDGFKYVNDSLGHAIGDKVLVTAADRLKRETKDKGLVSRYGGDEFLVLLEDYANTDELKILSQSILDSLSKIYKVDSYELFLSASIGIVIAPKDGDTVDGLIKHSDMAMFSAKNETKNCYRFFETSLKSYSYEELFLKTELNQALDNNEFQLYYQPKIDIKTQQIIGAEALIRWFKADGTIVPPNDFISFSESCGLIVQISEWVFESAARQLSRWQKVLPKSFKLSLNVSTLHFNYSNMIDNLTKVVSAYHINPKQIELEITESVVIDSPTDSIKKLETLRSHGFSIAIDDFGTGYSSFNYLKILPINVLKIDRSFINEINQSNKDLMLVKSIVDIAHTLGLAVVAEGVENLENHQLLEVIDCDIGQGYYYGKPMNADDFKKYLQQGVSCKFVE